MFLFESRISPAPTPKATPTSPPPPPSASPPAPQLKYSLHSRQFVLPDAPVEAAICIFLQYFKKKVRVVQYMYRFVPYSTVPYHDRIGTIL